MAPYVVADKVLASEAVKSSKFLSPVRSIYARAVSAAYSPAIVGAEVATPPAKPAPIFSARDNPASFPNEAAPPVMNISGKDSPNTRPNSFCHSDESIFRV